MNKAYTIHPPTTGKDDIKHPKLSKEGVIAKLGSSMMFIGNSGSGKSNLARNLLTRPEFYRDAFDKIFVISATGEVDDVLDELECTTISDLKEGIKAIRAIQEHQTKEIAKHGNADAHQYALVLDDCIGDADFIKSAPFLRAFIAPRHHNITTFLCAQHLRKVPKVCRMQASVIYVFACSASECEVLHDEYCPPGLNRKQFDQLLQDTWNSAPFQFLSIYMKQPMKDRYRRGLAEVIDLNYYAHLQPGQEQTTKHHPTKTPHAQPRPKHV